MDQPADERWCRMNDIIARINEIIAPYRIRKRGDEYDLIDTGCGGVTVETNIDLQAMVRCAALAERCDED